jgi:hypothetical protein
VAEDVFGSCALDQSHAIYCLLPRLESPGRLQRDLADLKIAIP